MSIVSQAIISRIPSNTLPESYSLFYFIFFAFPLLFQAFMANLQRQTVLSVPGPESSFYYRNGNTACLQFRMGGFREYSRS